MRLPHRSRQLYRIVRGVLSAGPKPLWLARRGIREHGAIQRTWELQSLLAEVRSLRPRTVVEIGTHRGGTLACWAVVAHPNAHLVSIDLPSMAGQLGAGYAIAILYVPALFWTNLLALWLLLRPAPASVRSADAPMSLAATE